jgi:DNA polymerase elongation subunit (family B)
MSTRDLIFHLLDLQSRDIRIEKEDDDIRECVYESGDEESDEEIGYKQKKKQNNFSKQQREFVIHLFGSTDEGQPLRVDVTGFRPTVYLKLPLDKPKTAAQCIKDYLNNMDFPTEDLTFKIIQRKIFYGFTANTYYPFLQIDMPSLTLYRNLRGLFLDEKMKPSTKQPLPGIMRGKIVEVYEANIDPMLRFIHTQNIQPCGWVSIKNGKSMIQNKNADMIILDCDYTDITPTKGPRVSAPFLTASWDIECFSMTGDFPLAKRSWKKAAKDSLLLAKTSNDIIDLIIKSLSVGQDPVKGIPKGMTPIYCQLKVKNIDMIRNILEKPSVLNSIEECLNERNGDMNERVLLLEKILDKYLKNYIKLIGDPVIQIGTTLTRGTPETTEHHIFVYPDCDPIQGIEVHSFKTEKQMIIAWFDWMIKRNPDILIGYNVFGFDERYLWERADELSIITSNASLHGFSRLNDTGSEMKLEENFLSSSAMGDNWLYIWSTHGHLQIDLYHYIKRNYVLPSYKLDEVTKNFMSGKIKKQRYDISQDNNEGILYLDVAGAIKDVKPGRAITLLDDTGETVSGKLVVESIDGSTISFKCSLSEEELAEMEDATKWVVVKDDVSPQDIFRLHRESSAGRAIVAKYCIQDCGLVLELYKKLETFNNSMSMANVCSVPVSYIFKRGQGIKIESLIFKACKERDILIPVLPSPKQRGEAGADDSYEGAIVLDPVPGFYSQSPIGVCDFASLYPSTIVSENISHDSLVWVKDFDYNGRLLAHYWGSEDFDDYNGYAYTDIEYDIWRPDPSDTRKTPRKVKCGRRICRYAQPLDGSKSTLPQITTWLLQAREAKKKEMKGEKDPERYALLDAEQLAYKLTGNSLYGQLGSSTFKIRLQALAASVTAYGRKQILFAKAAIEKFYGPEANDPRVSVKCMAKVVYGDSVTGDTPIVYKRYGEYNQITIQDLFNKYSDRSFEHHKTKNAIELNNIEIWTEKGWTHIKLVIRHKLASNKKLFRITTESGEVDVTEDHSLLLTDASKISPKDVTIGTELLHSIPYIPNRCTINTLSPIEQNSKLMKYIKFFQTSNKTLGGNKIISIEELPHPGDVYVYDLETENHHFGVGPGALIVHNTDSLFVEFNVKNPETGELLKGRDARQATIEITDEAGAFITKALKSPHDFEFDKAFDPMLMFSKKRYAGNMYEVNADDYVHKYMGIALKRRDNAPIVKTIFGGAMKMLLNDRDVVGAFKLVKDSCLDLVDGKVSFGQLVVTKSLRADYANPMSIAHKVLADRITARDPGNAPAAGDRIGYVHICPKTGQEIAKLQGDRIETPQFIKENGLVPDYKHYIEHQLQNPISQMFGILLEQIPGFDRTILKNCPPYPNDNLGEEEYKKCLDQYLGWRENEAAKLLFSDCLRRFETTTRRSAMANFFGPNTKIVINEKSSTINTNKVKTLSQLTNTSVNTNINTKNTNTTANKDKKQTTMSNFLLDSYLVENMKKKDRLLKASEKNEKNKLENKDKLGNK